MRRREIGAEMMGRNTHFINRVNAEKSIEQNGCLKNASVMKNGAEVFFAEAGRNGFDNSVEYDFISFASEIIGATYVFIDDAADRLMGFKLEVFFNVQRNLGSIKNIGVKNEKS